MNQPNFNININYQTFNNEKKENKMDEKIDG